MTYFPTMAWQSHPPLSQYRRAPLAPHVGPSKQPVRIALGERLAHDPLQSPALPRTLWQHLHERRMSEEPSAPTLSPEHLRQGEMQADSLFALLELVNACTKSTNQQLFVQRLSKGFRTTKLGFALANVLPVLVHLTRSDCRDLLFMPQIEWACSAFARVGLHQTNAEMPQPWQFADPAWNTLFEEFGDITRLHGRSAAAGRAQQQHDDRHRAHVRETKAYFAKVSRAHPAGYVVRAELEVPLEGSADHRTRFLHMHRLSGEFIRRVKLAYGDAIVGDARLIDRAGVNGYQAHVALVIDGPSHQELRGIEEALPGVWREPTGKGRLRNTHSIPMFQYRGTGNEYRDYESLATQLDKAAVYLAGTAQIYQVCVAGAPDGLVLGEASEKEPARRR